MRFKIDFSILGEKPYVLPVNYQQEFSAWIHKMLHFENPGFNKWITSKGYTDQQGEYQLYTFSDVHFPEIKHHEDRIILEKNNAGMLISFYAKEGIEGFIPEIFKGKEFKIGDSKSKVAFRIENMERASDPDLTKNEIRFRAVSPLLISDPGRNDGLFLNPDQKDFENVFFKSLMFKYANLVKFMHGANASELSGLQDLRFSLLSKPKSKIIKIKTDTPHQKSVKGYLFDFSVKAPEVLLAIDYHAGFGDLNNLGFGCCETI